MPTLKQLRELHNFTIESQVQYYGPLAFEPPRATQPDGSEYYALGSDELKIFVNSAEWSLCRVSVTV
jgi:phosphatidylinositol glycan class S